MVKKTKAKKTQRVNKRISTRAKHLHNGFRENFIFVFFICVIFLTLGFSVIRIIKYPPHFFLPIITAIFPETKRDLVIESYKDVVLHGDRNKKKIALTFDADMTPGMKEMLDSKQVESFYNKKVIDVLNYTHTKATLFLTGMWIELYPQETGEFSRNPLFELGNHSYSHGSFYGQCYGLKYLSDNDKPGEIQKTQMLLEKYAHVENFLFRFPGGCYSSKDLSLVHDNGAITIHWDVAGDDGFNQNTDSIVYKVLSEVQNGSIIVLHLNGGPNSPKTADAISEIIPKLKERGFEFVKVSELLHLPVESRN